MLPTVTRPVSFIIWTIVFMVLIGTVQIFFGVFDPYDAQEEAFELAAPDYEKYANNQKVHKIKLLLISRRSALEDYIRSLPSSRADALIERINTFILQFDSEQVIPLFHTHQQPDNHQKKITHENMGSASHHQHDHLWEPNVIERPFEDVTQGDYKQILLDVLLSRFFQEILWRFDVVIDHDRIQPRGQMKNHSIIMAANIRSFDELAKVLVHELGHIVDIYYLQRSGITRDLSHTYYEISWEDVDTQKSGASSSDFISGYATTNQYEDFAEAFTFFLFHNEEFLRRSQESGALQKKYDFLRGHVFGDYYQGSSFEKDPIPSYIWDTTKVGLKEGSREKAF